ncbi:hypothetical protein [uncultured Psychrobacter sp.]|uniref:hypothetical protein n=1 Tax=uncultured Psychrobacter sp. TaxID=259303 RepID=UPI00345AF32B
MANEPNNNDLNEAGQPNPSTIESNQSTRTPFERKQFGGTERQWATLLIAGGCRYRFERRFIHC